MGYKGILSPIFHLSYKRISHKKLELHKDEVIFSGKGPGGGAPPPGTRTVKYLDNMDQIVRKTKKFALQKT